ncbi:aspartic proteinase CDR1-like [Solanum stenotomum]|uniref:aspartic proteinase CDR1-like n=1 Tax=Solanum stenotomum TaxID=172797 RepID=UPI0020D13E82|nr:aspartic proteinase CDR1-like [Solanum stenotomum]
MKIKAFTLMPMLVLLSFFHLSLIACRKSVDGFTLDLIHHDSPLSPFYNPSNTPFERLQNAFHHSISRASFFKKKIVNAIQPSIITTSVDGYLMKISIGTPPIDILVIVDTASDLTWTQCEPCIDCFEQLAPIFNPKNSSSYKTIGCNNKICQVDNGFLTCRNNTCNYEAIYEDQSHTIGDLSIETFTFASTCGENISIPNIAFGCGHANRDSFTNNAISGIIGLGGGNVSIVNQMNKEIKGKFSYCFIPLELLLDSSNATSHINFGDNAVVLGPNVVSTPLILREEDPISYYLTLESISIGNKTLPFRSSKISPNDQGNIIIDSGTTYTFVPFDFYANLEKTLVSLINATRKNDPSGFLKLCYESQKGTINVPKIVAHFTNADIELPTTNTFTQLDECLVCFTMLHDDEIAIFGNLAQMNFLIGFDLVANKVSFLPTDCTKH